MYHVRRAAEITFDEPEPYAPNSEGYRRAAIVGPGAGAVHTGIAQCTLDPGGSVDEHLHSYEKSFYVLEGRPQLTIEGRTWQLAPDDCGLVPLGVPHSWRTSAWGEPCRWIEASAPPPRESGPADTFFTGEPAPPPEQVAEMLDIRDPRARTFFRLEPGQMELDNLRTGAPVDAPTVSASMATALLAYSGIALKMLVDSRLGAVLHQMFMVEYEPGGAAQLHDHPLEESYTMLGGEVEAEADGERFTLYLGDVFWTGVGCIHGFWNTSGERVRFLETQSPQLPANHSYRFNRDWDYLTERLGGGA
jgi:quercetin dioxygenase-like cupin family protein